MAPVPKPKRHRNRHFLKEWRKIRGYTQDHAAEALGMDRTNLSKIERGEVPYNQDFLEVAAEFYRTDPASLIMRDPSAPDAIWTLWDQAKPGQRQQIIDVTKALLKTGT